MKRVKPMDALDLFNLREQGTQHTKSVKLKESTYNFLNGMKAQDRKLKSLDDVIIHMATIIALRTGDN